MIQICGIRLQHISTNNMYLMKRSYPCYPCIDSFKTRSPCDICHFSKQRNLPFPSSCSKSLNYFDLVHKDIWGPFGSVSVLGSHFLTVVDDKSRKTSIFLMRNKSEAGNLVQSFAQLVETQYDARVKCIWSDNGAELKLKEFFDKRGIVLSKNVALSSYTEPTTNQDAIQDI